FGDTFDQLIDLLHGFAGSDHARRAVFRSGGIRLHLNRRVLIGAPEHHTQVAHGGRPAYIAERAFIDELGGGGAHGVVGQHQNRVSIGKEAGGGGHAVVHLAIVRVQVEDHDVAM